MLAKQCPEARIGNHLRRNPIALIEPFGFFVDEMVKAFQDADFEFIDGGASFK